MLEALHPGRACVGQHLSPHLPAGALRGGQPLDQPAGRLQSPIPRPLSDCPRGRSRVAASGGAASGPVRAQVLPRLRQGQADLGGADSGFPAGVPRPYGSPGRVGHHAAHGEVAGLRRPRQSSLDSPLLHHLPQHEADSGPFGPGLSAGPQPGGPAPPEGAGQSLVRYQRQLRSHGPPGHHPHHRTPAAHVRHRHPSQPLAREVGRRGRYLFLGLPGFAGLGGKTL